jgi:hypothetical protein
MLAVRSKQVADYVQMKNSKVGVVYSSGAGDYAEWLLKENAAMKFKPGQVVGIRGGKVSLITEGAEKVLVISTNPIVLGNSPEDGREMYFEKIAFMGQVPVRVLGTVAAGDYIVATGKNDGLAIAKSPADISPDDLVNIIGVAWTGAEGEEKSINVAVGLSTKDVRTMVQHLEKRMLDQKEELNVLRAQINSNNELLAKLVPGFKATPLAVEIKVAAPVAAIPAKAAVAIVAEQTAAAPKLETVLPKMQFDRAASKKIMQDMLPFWTAKMHNAEGNRLPAMTDDMIDKLLEMGVTYTLASSDNAGQKSAASTLMSEIRSNPTLKKMIFNNIKESYTKALEEDKLINNR